MASEKPRMRYWKTSSTSGAKRFKPKSQTMEVLGRTKLDLPDSSGRSSFHLATHWNGQGPHRHYLSGLHTLESRYRETELLTVAGTKVKDWSHANVTSCLRHHLAHVTSIIQCKLVLLATDHCGRTHRIEVQFDLLDEDGLSVGGKVRAVYDIIVRVLENFIVTPNVTDVTYIRCSNVLIRHGALTNSFLRVGKNNTLCMDVPRTPKHDKYVFKYFTFSGHNQTVCRRGRSRSRCVCPSSDVDSDGTWPLMCVLQEPTTHRFVVASALTHDLKTDMNVFFDKDATSIKKPDARFFVMHPNGHEQFCLRPLLLCNSFLRYDLVTGLILERCDTPPYTDPCLIRQFTFDFMPV